MTTDNRNPNDRFAELLAEVHEGVVAQRDTSDDHLLQHSIETNVEVAARLEGAEACLRLLERARRSGARPARRGAAFRGPNEIGRFQIQRLLGEGSYGVVYLALDPQLKRHVALKVPRPEVVCSPELQARFIREAEVAGALHHPNIVSVLEAGCTDQVHYIATAYCKGATLGQWMKDRGSPLPPIHAARCVAVLAEAIQHAHSRGVLHRDLKPSNVLIEGGEEDDELRNSHPLRILNPASLRITDFGLAKLIDEDSGQTRSAAIIGTPAYMAPEQAAGRNADVAITTDVHALGAILFELLTGSAPFSEATVIETLEAVRTRDAQRPSQLTTGVPRDLDAICLKCLEKEPERRYDSAAALAADLERFLHRQPVLARNVSTAERAWFWCRRNPLVAALWFAVVALAISSTMAAVLADRARRETAKHLANEITARRAEAERTFETYVAHAHAARRTRSPGQRLDSLDALRKAMRLADTLDVDQNQRLELRNATIASLSLVDLDENRQWPVKMAGDSFPDTDAQCMRYAQLAPDELEVLVRGIDDNRILARLPIDGRWKRVIGLRFSPDGKVLGARYERTTGDERLQLWHIDSAKTIVTTAIGGYGSAADFGPNGRSIALVPRDRSTVEVRALPSYDLLESIPFPAAPQTVQCHPSMPFLACYTDDGSVDICHVPTGRILMSMDVDSHVYSMAWNAKGQLAIGCRDGTVRVYDIDLKDAPLLATSAAPRMFDAHSSMVIKLSWHPSDDLLASSSMDGTTHLWKADSGRRLLTADGAITSFSRDGEWLGKAAGRWRVILSEEHRSASQPDVHVPSSFRAFGLNRRKSVTSEINYWEPHPAGRLLIGMNLYSVQFRDVRQDRPLAEVPFVGGMRFNSDGSALIAMSTQKGLSRLPIRTVERDDEIEMTIGPPEHLVNVPVGPFTLSDGGTLVLSPFLGIGQLLDRRTWTVTASLTPRHEMLFWSGITSDGRYVATGTFKGKGVEIRDGRDGKIVKRLESDSAAVWFSPDNRLLALAGNGGFEFWDVGTWRRVHRISSVPGGIFPCSIAFTSDGRVVAIEDGALVRLLETNGFSELASFHVPRGQMIESIQFTPDSEYLVVGGGDQGATQIWNLRLIREELSKMKLDWPRNTYDGQRLHPSKPIRLNLDLGDLATPETRFSLSLVRQLGWTPPDDSLADAHALWLRACKRQHHEYYTTAIDDFTRFIQSAGDDNRLAEAYHRRGVCYLRRQDYDHAVVDLEASLALQPTNAPCQNSLAWLHLVGGGQVRNPTRGFKLAHAANTKELGQWAYLKTLGIAYFRLRRFHEAVDTLERAHRSARCDVPSHHLFYLAMAYHQLGNIEQASLCYNAAAEWQELQHAHQSLFRMNEVKRFRREAETLLGDSVALRREMSSSPSRNTKLLTELDKNWKAVGNRPDDYRVWNSLSHALYELEAPHAAILACTVAIELSPTKHHDYCRRGFSYLSVNQHKRAVTDFEKSLELFPNNAEPMRHLAWVRAAGPASLRDPARARKLAQEATKVEPSNQLAAETLGVAFYREGRFKAAITQLQLPESMIAKRPVSLYFLALAHARLGDKKKAIRFYVRAERCRANHFGSPLEDLDWIRSETRHLLNIGSTLSVNL